MKYIFFSHSIWSLLWKKWEFSFFYIKTTFRYSRSQMFFQKGALKNFTIFKRKHVLESLFNKFVSVQARKETPIQVFSCEYCEIFKNTFFYRTDSVASVPRLDVFTYCCVKQSRANTRILNNLWTFNPPPPDLLL